MNNKKGIIHLLPLLLVGILIIGGGGLLIWKGDVFKRKSLTPNSIQQTDKSIQSTPKSLLVNTSDWKMYKNKELGISFKMPSYQDVIQNGDLVEISKSKKGQILISDHKMFNPNELNECDFNDSNNKSVCLNKNWFSPKLDDGVNQTDLNSKKTDEFYISERNGNSIYRIFQLQDNSFSIAIAVDGVMLKENSDAIINSIEFTK